MTPDTGESGNLGVTASLRAKVTRRALRLAWWGVLTIAAGAVVALRWDNIWTGALSELDRGLLVVLVLRLLLPLVSEFEGFGFKFRSQLDE